PSPASSRPPCSTTSYAAPVISHPELETEQAYVDRAYECMDAMHARVARLKAHGRNDYEEEVFERWRDARLAALSDTTSALVFGRLDFHDGDRYYVGRRHVEDSEGDAVVM